MDKLGADNCIDPEDFDQEDLDDELFKNLEISDIEEIFKDDEEPALLKCDKQNSDTNFKGSFRDQDASLLDCGNQAGLADLEKAPSVDEHHVLDQDSDLRLEEDDDL